MSSVFQVAWSRTAVRDLTGIIEYIFADNQTDERRALAKIKKAAAGLFHDPFRGLVIPELQEQGMVHYRELIIAPWRLMYRVEGETVYVVSLIDSRRNVEDILLGRFGP
ncbi:MAG: type II toxin-antitoxin system RelE/ParE family toxin [Desulfuromonadaceae bacterium]|nr:type II toxin-antitoxin system RelE/ParE family toxin [Desulfuromonadaceae bacterium]